MKRIELLCILVLIGALGVTSILILGIVHQQKQHIEILTERVILLEETIAETGGIKLEMPK